MRRIDPATEGKERFDDSFHEQYGSHPGTGVKISFTSALALPEELEFSSSNPLSSVFPSAVAFGAPPAGMLTWEDVVEQYGVVALLDPSTDRGVSIVPTKERLSSWELECKNFPRAPYDPEIIRGLDERIASVSPYTLVGEDGEFGRGRRCRSLLQAMYYMVYLDFTGGNKVRRCRRPDCRDYYRLGSQESDYCSPRCTSVMTTRRSRTRWS